MSAKTQKPGDEIARVVHESVRAWAAAHGEAPMPAWNNAPAWMKASTRESVAHILAHPDEGPGAQHVQWMNAKLRDGWRLGPVKDAAAKTHPLLIPYDELPDFQQRKDALVIAVVKALAS